MDSNYDDNYHYSCRSGEHGAPSRAKSNLISLERSLTTQLRTNNTERRGEERSGLGLTCDPAWSGWTTEQHLPSPPLENHHFGQSSWNQQKNCTSHAKSVPTEKEPICIRWLVVSTITDDDSDLSYCKMYVEADTRQSTHLINNNCQNQ